MNLLQSTRTYDELIQHMRDCGYSNCYIKHIMKEVNWLSKHSEDYGFDSYQAAYQIRSSQTTSSEMKEKYRVIYGIFRRYAIFGKVCMEKRKPLFQRGAYTLLNPYFKSLLDTYKKVSIDRGLKEGTYRAAISACSGMLLYFQQLGHKNLDKVSECDVLSYFSDEKGNARMSSSTKVNIASVFEADLGCYATAARRILTYLTCLKRRRKTIQYLTEEEISAVKKILADNSSCLSFRNRAVGMLMYFTGMRCSDISSLHLHDIDWENDEIRIAQKKTGITLVLPLTAPIGNAVFDYISIERPESDHTEIFLCESAPYKPISPGTVGNIADKIYDAASIRQCNGDRRGAHLFRHNLASSFAGNGIARPVISSTLGHSDPDSIDHYLFADIKNIRNCAISIEKYPVGEEVFRI